MWDFLREMTMMKTTTTTTMVMVTASMSKVMVAATATTNLKSQVHTFPISYVMGKDHESFHNVRPATPLVGHDFGSPRIFHEVSEQTNGATFF